MRHFLMRVRSGIVLALALTIASGAVASAQVPSPVTEPSTSSGTPGPVGLDPGDGPDWASVVHSEQGPGETWIEYGLGGVVAVLQPDEGPPKAWRSGDGLEWDALELPADLGTVSDVVSLLGDLALITDEVRSGESWSFGSIALVGDADREGEGRSGGAPWALVSRDGLKWYLSADWTGGDGFALADAWAMDAGRVVVLSDGEVWYADLVDLGLEPLATPAETAAPTLEASTVPMTKTLAEQWGPLAVSDDSAIGGLDAGLGPGRLVIGPDCVTLVVEDDVEVTLIWRNGETEWDPFEQQIVFDDRDEGLVRLSSGDRLVLGGAPLMPADSPDQGAGQPSWVTEPDASCPIARWVVHQVDLDR